MNRSPTLVPLAFVLLLGLPSAGLAQGNVQISAPLQGATLDALEENRLVYAVDPGPRGDHVHVTIVERGSFVMPEETEFRWQSHFDVAVPVPAAEGLGATRRFAYYLVVEPVVVGSAGPAQRDSTRETATPDSPDDITRVQQTIWSKGIWLWVVDRPSGKVLAKGPLLPGSCP